MMKKWNKIFALLLALIMVFGLVACGSSDKPGDTQQPGNTQQPAGNDPATTPEDNGPKVFVFGADANSASFNTATDLQTNSARTLVNGVCETLWTVDDAGNATCKLAESYEWTGDLELTVKLPAGVTFSNGNPLTSEDVYYTLTLFRDSGRTAAMVACVDFEKTHCPDETTIVIVLNTYDAGFFSTLGSSSFSILDAETCTAADWAWGWLYGTGPYKLKGNGLDDKSGWEESVQYTLVRNESYRGEAPYYDEIIVKFYSEESTRFAEFQAGNLDACYLTQATYIKNLGDGAVVGAELVRRGAQATYGFALSGTTDTVGAMADINIRKAFAHGMNIAEIVEILGEGVYETATSILGEDNWAYKNVGTYEYDPELAAQYLAAAGYSVDNPLTLTVTAESTAFNSALAEAAQGYLGEIGINLDLSGMGDFPTILPVLLSGTAQVNIGGPSNGASNDPTNLLQQMGPKSDANLLRMIDPRLADLFQRGAASRDQAERVGIYQEFQQIVHDDYTFIPMWVETKNYGVLAEHASFASALDATNMLDPTLLTD